MFLILRFGLKTANLSNVLKFKIWLKNSKSFLMFLNLRFGLKTANLSNVLKFKGESS